MAYIQQNSALDWKIHRPYTEKDVLYLHELFLKPGIHSVNTDNMQYAQSVVLALLKSLNHFQDAAYISTSNSPTQAATNLYGELDQYYAYSSESIIEYLNDFSYDFLWIEESKELQECLWYHAFMRLVTDTSVDKFIPIVVVRQR